MAMVDRAEATYKVALTAWVLLVRIFPTVQV
jgi:hypothetical protein